MTKQQIQNLITSIADNANNKAVKVRTTLNAMLDFSSDGQTLVFDNIQANNTTSATTTVLEYGVNIIRTSSATDYACKLPQPVTGKRTIIVNATTLPLYVFPSNIGGQINNNPINAPAIIPPDGKAYDFICIENPLPGAWVWSPPAIAQYDSGDIQVNTANNNNVYSAAASNLVVENSAFASFTSWGDDGLNKPSLPLVLFNNTGFPNNFVAFKPGVGWNGITKIKVYTNLAFDINNDCSFGLTAGSCFSSYSGGLYVGITSGTTSVVGNYNQSNPYGAIDQLSPGATLPFGTLTPNVGDPGTTWGELVMSDYNVNGSRVGTFYEGLDSNSNDFYFTQMVNFQIQPRQALSGFKFRFFIEYF